MNQKSEGLILLVDDDPYVRDSISSFLSECGYSVIACDNAIDAMAKLIVSFCRWRKTINIILKIR